MSGEKKEKGRQEKERRETENKINKGEETVAGEPAVSCPPQLERKFLTSRRRLSHMPPRGVRKEIRRLELYPNRGTNSRLEKLPRREGAEREMLEGAGAAHTGR